MATRRTDNIGRTYCVNCEAMRRYTLTPDCGDWECDTCGCPIECTDCGRTLYRDHDCARDAEVGR